MLHRTKVFISYSQKDTRFLEELQTVLRPLEREGRVEYWADRKIKPGKKWREEIETALNTAKIAVLLVSPNFHASDFVSTIELPVFFEAERQGELTILPIAISHCADDDPVISVFQTVNEPKQPMKTLDPAERDKVWLHLVKCIKTALDEPLRNQSSLVYEEFSSPQVKPDMVPPVGVFINREEHISEVGNFLKQDLKKLAVIQGLPGIGKTTLGARLARENEKEFAGVFWINCKSEEAFADVFFSKIDQFFRSTHETGFSTIWKDPVVSLEVKINVLIAILSRNRFLFVLDKFHEWLSDDLEISNEDIRQVVAGLLCSDHQSKIIVLSDKRVPLDPQVFRMPAGTKLERTVKGFEKQYAIDFLKEIGVVIEDDELATQIIADCDGSPQMLMICAFVVNDLYTGPQELLRSEDFKLRSSAVLKAAIDSLNPGIRGALEQLSILRIPLNREQLAEFGFVFQRDIKPLLDKFLLFENVSLHAFEVSGLVRVHLKNTLPENRLDELHSNAAKFYERVRR